MTPDDATAITPEDLFVACHLEFEKLVGLQVDQKQFRMMMTMLASRYSSGGIITRFHRATEELAKVYHEPATGTFPLPEDPLARAALLVKVRPYRYWVLLLRASKVGTN